jgi:hypothetical protein
LTGPPKALDEDETEFLDSLEMYKKQQEQELAQEEARELTGFHQYRVGPLQLRSQDNSYPPLPPLMKPFQDGEKDYHKQV